jgi:hypothetical protein
VATITTTVKTDDLDGKPAAETITFGLDGLTYEIDLTRKNAAALRRAFQPWQESARRVPRSSRNGSTNGSRHHGSRRGSQSVPVDAKAVRAWAASNGIELSPNGRLPKDVLERYRAAH